MKTDNMAYGLTHSMWQSFEKIYATDLVYVSNCWKLCGDAHCCSFARYKAKFRLIARTPFQELPLLPGEYEYLQAKGWLAQFGDHDHKVVEYPLDGGNLRVESIISRRPLCACDHDTRPTICRLYPLLPVFTIDGALLEVESVGLYELLEEIEGLAPACQLTALPFNELQKLLVITGELARHPIFLYYLAAYRQTKAHVQSRLLSVKAKQSGTAFALFESLLIRKNLIDHATLKAQLDDLLNQFRIQYGGHFQITTTRPGALQLNHHAGR